MRQFIHLDSYGRTPKAGGPAWADAAGILNEAARIPGSVGHIEEPMPPEILFGVPPDHLIVDVTGLAELAVDAKGRNLRRDGSVLVAGVVSYPQLRDEMRREPADGDTYMLWRRETVDWLSMNFVASLRSVVEHYDENFLHLHFYALPTLNPDRTLDWSAAHPGLRAKREAAKRGESQREQDRSYVQAMTQFQNRFFSEVSEKFGHRRYGDRKERVSRMEWAAQKRIEVEQREALERLKIAEHESLLEAENKGLERVRVRVETMEQAIEKLQRDRDFERERAESAEEEIARLMTLLARSEEPGVK